MSFSTHTPFVAATFLLIVMNESMLQYLHLTLFLLPSTAVFSCTQYFEIELNHNLHILLISKNPGLQSKQLFSSCDTPSEIDPHIKQFFSLGIGRHLYP